MEASKVSNYWTDEPYYGLKIDAERRDRAGRFLLTEQETGTNEEAGTAYAVWQLLKASDREPVHTYRHPINEKTKEILDDVDRNYGFHPGPGAAISGDGSTVVTIAGNGAALVWSTDSDKPLRQLKASEDEEAFADVIYLTPQGDKALIGYNTPRSEGNTRYFYEIFSLGDGKSLAKVSLQLNQVLLAASKNLSSVIIAHGESASVRDAYDFHLIGQEVRHTDRVDSARFSNDERAFCTGSYDATFRFWDTATGFPLAEPLVFDEKPKWKKGDHDEYWFTLPNPLFTDDGKRIAVVDAADTTADGLSTLSLRTWDVSLTADADDAKLLEELATLIYGAKLNENGALIHLPQPSMTELGERFGKYKGAEDDIGKLVEWLLTARESRQATPYSGQ